jgi:hypothetical protein
MIGPWLVIVNGESISMYAITMIDTVTNLVELFRIDIHQQQMQHGPLRWLGYSTILVQSESSMTRAMNFRAWTFKSYYNNMALKMFQHQFEIHKQMLCVSECIRLWATFYKLYCTPILQLISMMSGPW